MAGRAVARLFVLRPPGGSICFRPRGPARIRAPGRRPGRPLPKAMNPTAPAPAGRNYPLLLAGQFLGAFGDNFLLAAVLGPLTYALGAGRITESAVNAENALFGLVFSIPFIVLAPLAGFLNDRMPKTRWLVGGNLVKLGGCAVGLMGVSVLAGRHSHLLQVAGYCVVGIGACVYSPAKYGILPEVVANARLVKANGTVEMLTLVAIVAGLGGGGILYDRTLSLPVCYWASLALYAGAFVCNAAMARTPFNPDARLRRSFAEFGSSFLSLVTNPRLGRILLGSALFWFAGSTVRSALQGWGLSAYAQAGIADVTNLKLVLLKIGLVAGIVLGAVLAGQLHRTGDLSWARRYALLLGAGFAGLGLLGGRFGLAPPSSCSSSPGLRPASSSSRSMPPSSPRPTRPSSARRSRSRTSLTTWASPRARRTSRSFRGST